jgi:hypothetical protein
VPQFNTSVAMPYTMYAETEEEMLCEIDAPGFSDFHTTNPPDCNGMGVLDENKKCVCQPSHTGDECETQVCALEQQACSNDSQCCNACVCEDGESKVECCGPQYNPQLPFMSCQANYCQRIS